MYTCQMLYDLLTTEYLPAFLAFARTRTGDFPSAEELAQEIAFRCVTAISEGRIRENPDAYFRGVMYNTWKSHLTAKKNRPASLDAGDFGHFLPSDDESPEEILIREDELARVRAALSRLSGEYRRVLVSHYYENRSVKETAAALGLTEDMVKFYLRAGRGKLKEVFCMKAPVSVAPVDFYVYKAGIDFSRVNVWEVFRRKLPGQIAVLCHDSAKTVQELSMESGVPAVYLEEELALLLDAGVMVEPARGKYRTNFHILKKEAAEQVRVFFERMFADYIPAYRAAYEAALPRLRESGIFRHDANEQEYRWYFYGHTECVDFRNIYLSERDYPQILSCGSKSFVFAMEAPCLRFSAGHTPTALDCGAAVWPCDVTAFGDYHRQNELRSKEKSQVLYDIAMGNPLPDDENTCLHVTALLEEGYVEKTDAGFVSRVPVTDGNARAVLASVNETLAEAVAAPSAVLWQKMNDLVAATIVPQLSEYARGFAVQWISLLSGAYFAQALYEDGFLRIPEEGDDRPYACEIIV
ncbi:MAG: RNA polymerase sigma factor [Clostridia bacterium]|nr:RNA polymerase sigma factor [Clostridia bacterium]